MECKRIFIRRLHLTNMRYNLTNYEKPGLDSYYSSILHLFIYVQMYFCCTRACMCVPISACECVCVVRTSAYVRACMCVCMCACVRLLRWNRSLWKRLRKNRSLWNRLQTKATKHFSYQSEISGCRWQSNSWTKELIKGPETAFCFFVFLSTFFPMTTHCLTGLLQPCSATICPLSHTRFTFDLTLRPKAPDHKAGF